VSVGNSLKMDLESLEHKAVEGCTLGDLSPGERAELWDLQARQRASTLLSILQRLKVRNAPSLLEYTHSLSCFVPVLDLLLLSIL